MMEPTLAEVIRAALDSRLNDVHVALPGKIVTYNPSTQEADVLPTIRRALPTADGGITHEDLPIIPAVPVVFPRGGGYSMTWPLAPGDHVLLVVCSSAIGQWAVTGITSDPVDLRRHDLSHAVAIPGIAPVSGPLPTLPSAVLAEVLAPLTHLQVGQAAVSFVALATLVEALVGQLAGAILNAAPVAGDGGAAIQLAAKGVLTGLGWTGGGTIPPAAATAATKLKSE